MWRVLDLLVRVCTCMIGFHIHGSIFWSIMDFIFYPVAWAKWLFYGEACMSVIKETFAFFLK